MNDFEDTWYSNLQKIRKKERQSKHPNIEEYVDHFSELVQKIGRHHIKKIISNITMFNPSLKIYLTKKGVVYLKVEHLKQFIRQLDQQCISLKNTSQTKAEFIKKSTIIKERQELNFNLEEVEIGFFQIYKKLKVSQNQHFEKEAKYMMEIIERQLEDLSIHKQQYIGCKHYRKCPQIIEEITKAELLCGTYRNIQPYIRLKTKALDELSQNFHQIINTKYRLKL